MLIFAKKGRNYVSTFYFRLGKSISITMLCWIEVDYARPLFLGLLGLILKKPILGWLAVTLEFSKGVIAFL